MKNLIIICCLLFLFSGCKEDIEENPTLDLPNPMVNKNGWNLIKHSPEFYFLESSTFPVPITLEVAKEHPEGIDILYSSIFQVQSEVKYINVRWRAYHEKDHDVKKVVINEVVNKDPLGRPIISGLVNAYSAGMGETELYAITQIDKRSNTYTDPPQYQYDYFNVRSIKNNISSTWFKFKSTQDDAGFGSANPADAFVCNRMNARKFQNQKNIYTLDDIDILAAAPKGNKMVMLAIRDSLLYVLESSDKIFTHSSGSYGEELNAVIIKNIFNLHKFTGTNSENYIDALRFFYNDENLYVFCGLRNKKHRFFKIDLYNYTMTSQNESLYEKIDLVEYKNIILMEDRPGELLAMEKDGIHWLADNTKTFIPSPSIKQGSTGTNVNYSNGKIWQILFDTDGSYLINRAL